MRIGDLIELKSVPTVIQLEGVSHAVGAEFEGTSQRALRELVSTYLIIRGANEAALESILTTMTKETGCAHMLSGAYGTGKSHMLALIGLLCQFQWARELFASSHERYSKLMDELAKRKWLVTFTSLDAYSPTAPLEQIIWDETVASLKRTHPHAVGQKLPSEMPSSRAEALTMLQSAANALGYDCTLWVIDELSMFLGAKGHRELQADASFLQFIAQHCQRSRAWLIVAIQKTIEELGELEPYSLTQIKDRYVRHTLSFAHARQLIRKNLLPPKDGRQFAQVMLQWHRKLLESFPMIDFSAEELIACYPLHPFTLACLERATGRFFSRTRSIVDFVQKQAQELVDCDAFQLITPDAIYEHFYADIISHPELHPYADEVIPYLDERVSELFPERQKAMRKLARALVVFKMAGIDASVRKLAHTFLWDLGLGAEMNYSYMLSLLETLRTNANYIDCVRREEDYGDTYSIDLGATVTEMLQRRLQALIETFSDEDIRVVEYALRTMSTSHLPVPQIGTGHTFTTQWQNASFSLMLQCVDLRELTKDWMLNLQNYIASPSCAYDVHALIAPPIAADEQMKSAIELLYSLEENRFRYAIPILIPRAVGRGEMMRLMENAAASILASDPSLKDSDIGVAIYKRLREEENARASETQRILRNAYLNGTLLIGGKKLPISALIPTEASISDVFTAIAGASIPKVFPQFSSVAPRSPVRPSDEHRKLVNAILAGEGIQKLSADLRELWRCIAIPLGITAQLLDGTAPCDGAARLISELIAGADVPIAYEQIISMARKSEYGLREEQCELLIAALLKRGEALAHDRYGATLSLQRLSSPLRRCVATLSTAPLIERETWEEAILYADGLSILPSELEMKFHPAVQQMLWQSIVSWKEHASGICEQAHRELLSLMTQLQHSNALWSHSLNAIGTVGVAISAVAAEAIAHEGLKGWVATLEVNGISWEELKSAWSRCTQLHDALVAHGEKLRKIHAWLTDVSLRLSGDAKALAQQLLEALDGGESILGELDWFVSSWERLLSSYISDYLRHHENEHSVSRFEPYIKIRRHSAFRLLNRMAQLRLPMREAIEAMRTVSAELSKQCAITKEQLARQLYSSPICQSCKLMLGEHIPLVPPEEITSTLEEMAKECKGRFLSHDVRGKISSFMERLPASTTKQRLERLLNLSISDSHDVWLEALSDDVIECINTALSPTPTAIRSLQSLCERLVGSEVTKAQAVRVFLNWLDEPTQLKPFDVVRFIRGEDASQQNNR
ncbi:MAG: DUF6079 family protein [Armatimonadota bacterium]|nr:DUF6079 family protein [Armatimonadota bacterium]MCX7776678.1 DUF6079 family protein [Armatimonadota bacterium]MDW8025707.1 DUF6079 family protein [Armatimonadota bacterium]